MKKTIFTGAATAIVTPFKNGVVDYDMYGTLIDWQIEQGIDAIVTVGTTGEGPTLTHEEHREVIRYCVEKVAHRVPVIAGTGSNCTEEAIGLTKFAAQVGADAALLVTPYYNKATQAGLVASFTAVADAADLPCVLYNVPGRTGCNIQPATVAKLAEHPMICAVKEASGNISQVAQHASCSSSTCRLSMRFSARSTPSPSRLPWRRWATARTVCACRSPAWSPRTRSVSSGACATWGLSRRLA